MFKESMKKFSLFGMLVAAMSFSGLGWADDEPCDPSKEECPPAFKRMDADGDGKIVLLDALYILQYMFANGPEPPCLDAADVLDDGHVDVGDVTEFIRRFFDPVISHAPDFNSCLEDPTPDDGLTCHTYNNCDK